MELTKPKAIVFDWDNTLVDSWPVIHKALHNTYVAFGKAPMSLEEVKANVKYSMRDSFPRVFGDDWHEAQDKFYADFSLYHLEELEKLPGVDDFLSFLQDKGILMSLVSNKTGRFLRTETEYLDWNKYFHRVIGAGDAANDKPAVDPLHLALAETGFDLDESIWFVGDSEVDIRIAENAKCTGILLHFNEKPADWQAQPHKVHSGFTSLMDEISRFF